MQLKKIVKKLLPRKWWGTIVTVINSRATRVKAGQIKDMIKQYEEMLPRETLRYRKEFEWMIDESKSDAGGCGAYYWQDLWAASKIIKRRPEVHYDIGSRIDGFVAHLQAAEQNTVLIDIRKMESKMPFVKFYQADATSLEGITDESVESISALCSLEHFGLGRYGDPIDPGACFKAMKSIQRVVKKVGMRTLQFR